MSENIITNIEEALICNFEDDVDITGAPIYIQHLWSGKWEELICNNIVIQICSNYTDDTLTEELCKFNITEGNTEEVFATGVACLLAFMQANFTGPLSVSITDFFDDPRLKDRDFKKLLSLDGEDVNVNIKHPELIVIAKDIFENSNLDNTNLKTWWYLRYVIIHQLFLDECVPTLFTNIENKLETLTNWNLNNHLKAKLYLEIAQMYLLFSRINAAEKIIEKTKELLSLSFDLSGELGKRTKFQQNEIAQILLRVHLNDTSKRTVKNVKIPEIVELDDDVRYDSIQYSSKQNAKLLTVIEQAVLLTTVQYMQKARPKDELLAEETESFLSYLLQQKNSWTIHFVTLLMRCQLECNHKRTIERSLSQCESLIQNLNISDPLVVDRVSLVWCTGLPPIWKMEEQMANMMLNLGLVNGALDIYLRLQIWEEVIICYTILKMRHKAAEVIQTQLEQKQTVKLWCLLGDATDDVTCYEKAWELSDHKSSRAQRHWGNNLYFSKKYAECIPHLQISLDINSLQNIIWLRLGYAAMCIEDWKLAASCYRRYTSLEPGGFAGWNNLARAYVKLGEKTRAHFALQEALKYNFDNWKVWDNFMVVSASTSQFFDVIRAYHTILDLKDKHLDVEVLFLLLKSIMSNENETDESKKLLSKTRELFGRLTSIYPNESELWDMYSDIAPTADLKAQRLFRAYRGLVQYDWSKDPVKCGKVLQICRRLGEASLKASSSSISSTRLTLKSAVAAAKKHGWEENKEVLEEVENILEKIVDLCKQM